MGFVLFFFLTEYIAHILKISKLFFNKKSWFLLFLVVEISRNEPYSYQAPFHRNCISPVPSAHPGILHMVSLSAQPLEEFQFVIAGLEPKSAVSSSAPSNFHGPDSHHLLSADLLLSVKKAKSRRTGHFKARKSDQEEHKPSEWSQYHTLSSPASFLQSNLK